MWRVKLDRGHAKLLGDFELHAQARVNAGEYADGPFDHKNDLLEECGLEDVVWVARPEERRAW
jgi:hypothetical protein